MFRLFNPQDLPVLTKIESLSQIAPWSEDVFNRCFALGSTGWVAEVDGKIIGFVMILFQLDEVHILNFCIHPEHQRQGFGFRLLKHALDNLKEEGCAFVYLEVRRSNQNAIALYKKLGFRQIGERKDYYTKPAEEDALVFAKDIAAE